MPTQLVVAALEAWVATAFDQKTRRIPNELNSLYLLANLAYVVLSHHETMELLSLGLVLAMTFVGILVLYRVGIGGGDAKLMLALSPLIGPQYLGLVMILSSLIALRRRPLIFCSSHIAVSLTALSLQALLSNG